MSSSEIASTERGDLKEGGSENSDDGFTLVQRKKKRVSIIGSKKNITSKGNLGGNFKSARKVADLYIGNCDTEVTCEIISKYILDEMGIKIENCIALESKSSSSSSFKITLNLDDRLKLLSPDSWPEGIICRRFYSPRSLNQS